MARSLLTPYRHSYNKDKKMLHYPLKITVDNPGWLVESRDISQLVTGAPRGTTKEYAAKMGFEAFRVVAELLMERGRAIPLPSECQVGEEIMPMTLNVTAKIWLWNAIVQKGLKPAEIAKRLGPLKYPMTKFKNLDDPIPLDVLVELCGITGMNYTLRVGN
jgi:antitoxin HicB